MNIPINRNFVTSLKQSSGSLKLTISDVKEIIKYIDDDSCKIIIMDKKSFIVFNEISSVEFIVLDYKKEIDLAFLNNKNNKIINVSKKNGNYVLFMYDEFFQGTNFLSRVKRFIAIAVPILTLNILGILYGNQQGVGDIFTGLLAAGSIFVAIFSLFITSHDYLTRRRLSLFESGQLSYYFSIDKYITQTGIYSIMLSVFGLIITSGYNSSAKLYSTNIDNIIVVVILNLTFIAVYIILRSMVEFYIIRPGKFMLSDLKTDSFENYRQNKDKK